MNKDQLPLRGASERAGLQRPFVTRSGVATPPSAIPSTPAERLRPFRTGESATTGRVTPDLEAASRAAAEELPFAQEEATLQVDERERSSAPADGGDLRLERQERQERQEFDYQEELAAVSGSAGEEVDDAPEVSETVELPEADADADGTRGAEETSPLGRSGSSQQHQPTTEEAAIADTLESIARGVRAGRVQELLLENPRDTLTALVVGYVAARVRSEVDDIR